MSFYTDWLWFGETGYQAVYGRTLYTQSLLLCGTALAAMTVFVATLRVALGNLAPRELVMMSPEGPVSFSLNRRRLQGPATAISAVVALLFGIRAASDWELWLMAWHAQPFGTTDPILGKDVGFYVFQLPLLEAVQATLLGLVVVALIATVAVYARGGHHQLRRRRADCEWALRPGGTCRYWRPRCSSSSPLARGWTCRACW